LSTQEKTTIGRSVDAATLASFTVALLALLFLIWLGTFVRHESTQDLDNRIRMAVNQHSSAPLTYLMKALTQLGATHFLLPATACAVLILVRFGQPVSALLFVILMEGAVLLDVIVKNAVRRGRPTPFFGLDLARSYSFPSGHALFSFCFYVLLGAFITARVHSRISNVFTWIVVVVLVGLIGVSRVYLGIHYPTDVVGGYAAGLACTGFMMGVHRALRILQQTNAM
jgi:undecaprenyl-diphosphatase